MDIKGIIETVIKRVEENPQILAEFKDDPAKAVKDISGIEIPEGAIEAVIAGVKAKLFGEKVTDEAKHLGASLSEKAEEVEEKAGGIFDAIKKLF